MPSEQTTRQEAQRDDAVIESELRCPECGHTERLAMPTDACLFFHECSACHTLLRPNAGDCCVFCSFGTVPCPPIQESRRNGGSGSCCGGA